LKVRKTEILISAILSILIWIYFAVYSKKLDGSETIFVTGVILLLVFSIGQIIRKTKKEDDKK